MEIEKAKNNDSSFYHRFVNEENLKNIDDTSIQRKFWTYAFSMMLFSVMVGTLPTFIGYNFENVVAIVTFVIELFFFFWLLYFSIKFVHLDKKYSVFKKRCYGPLFSLGYFVLSVSFAISANFTTTFTSNPDSSFSVHINPIFFLTIFLPLFFAYAIFCYYAYMKCFAKYAKVTNKTNN